MAGGSGSQSPLNSRGTPSGFPSWEDLSTWPPRSGCVGGDCFSGICLVPAGPQRRPETGPTLPSPRELASLVASGISQFHSRALDGLT